MFICFDLKIYICVYALQYVKEPICFLLNYKKKMEIRKNTSEQEVKNLEAHEGALWYIFGREEVPKLEKHVMQKFPNVLYYLSTVKTIN